MTKRRKKKARKSQVSGRPSGPPVHSQGVPKKNPPKLPRTLRRQSACNYQKPKGRTMSGRRTRKNQGSSQRARKERVSIKKGQTVNATQKKKTKKEIE